MVEGPVDNWLLVIHTSLELSRLGGFKTEDLELRINGIKLIVKRF